MINESLMTNNDDDDVEKDEEDKEEEEHLAPADPSAVPTDDPPEAKEPSHKNQIEVLEHMEGALPQDEEKPIKTLIKDEMKLKRESWLAGS
ncbi:hypothetical protein Tco_0926324 [Tanacetum coccineum]|uniref:Uncharacterized protein n=1 Tax=Tanacetum coccineum TaxID=301880 RepID=A0ABQ5DAL8_9ASTR